MNNTFTWSPDELYHHGILGMKWGRRRWQNPDGTLTEAGKRRYGTVEEFDRRTKKLKDMTDRELQLNLDRQRKINEYKRLTRSPLVDKALDTVKAISENRNRRREQALKDKELDVKAKESEDAKQIAKYKVAESKEERKTYETAAKKTEMKSRLKDSKANLKRAKSDYKKLSLFSVMKRLHENKKMSEIDHNKNVDEINRIVEQANNAKIEKEKAEWNAKAERYKAAGAHSNAWTSYYKAMGSIYGPGNKDKKDDKKDKK